MVLPLLLKLLLYEHHFGRRLLYGKNLIIQMSQKYKLIVFTLSSHVLNIHIHDHYMQYLHAARLVFPLLSLVFLKVVQVCNSSHHFSNSSLGLQWALQILRFPYQAVVKILFLPRHVVLLLSFFLVEH